jgi:hypothetical protein
MEDGGGFRAAEGARLEYRRELRAADHVKLRARSGNGRRRRGRRTRRGGVELHDPALRSRQRRRRRIRLPAAAVRDVQADEEDRTDDGGDSGDLRGARARRVSHE